MSQRKAFISGWCRPDQREPHHGHCRGAFTNPVDKRTIRCACDCHTGEEAPLPATSVAEAKIRKLSTQPGKRSRALLEEIYHALFTHGIFELELTEEDKDPKVLKSKKERIYSAARRKGMKVNVRVIDGKIVAKPKV